MYAQFERFGIEMTLAEARGCSHQGRCDDDVAALRRTPKMRRQLAKLDPEQVKAELREYGAWDGEELADHEANLDRVVWLAAGNIADENCY